MLATQKAEIRRIVVQSQLGQIVLWDRILKKSHHIKGLVEWFNKTFAPNILLKDNHLCGNSFQEK
jgi:hypothetical protein